MYLESRALTFDYSMERNKIADYLDGNFGHLFKQTFSKIAGSSFLSVRSLLLMDC